MTVLTYALRFPMMIDKFYLDRTIKFLLLCCCDMDNDNWLNAHILAADIIQIYELGLPFDPSGSSLEEI